MRENVLKGKESIIIDFKNATKEEMNIENLNLEQINDEFLSQRDLKKEKISYLLQNHFCEETIITRCSIPVDFKFKNNINK